MSTRRQKRGSQAESSDTPASVIEERLTSRAPRAQRPSKNKAMRTKLRSKRTSSAVKRTRSKPTTAPSVTLSQELQSEIVQECHVELPPMPEPTMASPTSETSTSGSEMQKEIIPNEHVVTDTEGEAVMIASDIACPAQDDLAAIEVRDEAEIQPNDGKAEPSTSEAQLLLAPQDPSSWWKTFLHLLLEKGMWLVSRVKVNRVKKRLRVCESVSLGEKRFLAVIQVDGEEFLVGGASNSISTLARLDRSQEFSDVLKQQWAEDPASA